MSGSWVPLGFLAGALVGMGLAAPDIERADIVLVVGLILFGVLVGKICDGIEGLREDA